MKVSDKALYILQPVETLNGVTFGGPQWIRKWHRSRQVSTRTTGCATVATTFLDEERSTAWVNPAVIDDYRTRNMSKEFPPRTSMAQLEEWVDEKLCRLGAIPLLDSDSWRNDELMVELWDKAWMQGLHDAEHLDAVTVSSVTSLLRTLRQAALEEKLPYHIPHVGLQLGDHEVVVLEWWNEPRDLTIHVVGEEILWIYSESSQVTQMKDGALTSSDLPALRRLWRHLLQGTSGQVHSSQEDSAS